MPSYWDEDLAILSAENVNFSVETAGLGSRFAAATIDMTAQLLIVLLCTLAVNGFFNYLLPIESLPNWALNVCYGLAILGVFTLFTGYYFLFEWLWDGQTPGKRQLGLRTMMSNGMPLMVWPALSRNLMRWVDFLPFCYGLGSIVAITNPLNQRAGDLVAGTIVVRERRQEKERKPLTVNEAVDLFLATATRVPGTGPTTAPLQEEELAYYAQGKIDPEAAGLALRLDREDYELARGFLLRRETLPALSRDRLSRSLAIRLAAKLNQPVPTDRESFLLEVVNTLARAYGL